MKSYSILLLFFATFHVYGQQEPVLAQFSSNLFMIQPAVTGASKFVELRGSYRAQWNNFPGSPRTLSASLQGGLNEKNGIGFSFIRDDIGVNRTQRMQFSYAFHIPMAKDSQRLSIGAGFSFNRLIPDLDRIFFPDRGDIALQAYSDRISYGDIVLGVHYEERDFYVGIASPNLVRTSLNGEVEAEIVSRLYRNLYLIGGYRFRGKQVDVEPVLWIKRSDNIPLQVEANLKVHLVEGRIMFGLGYRSGFRGSIMTGFRTPSRIHILYIADFPAGLNGSSNLVYGISNELMLGFDIPTKRK